MDIFITGHKGSGKTLLAFAMADYFLKKGWVRGVWSNVPHKLQKADSIANAMVILDEAADRMDSRDSAQNYSMYTQWARKTATWYCFPSVNAIDNRARNLTVMRLFQVEVLPVPIWVYEWNYSYGDKGFFLLVNPQHYFGVYEHLAVPVNDGGVLECLVSFFPQVVEDMLQSKDTKKKLAAMLGITEEKQSFGGRGSSIQAQRVQLLEDRVLELEKHFQEMYKLMGIPRSEL